MDKVERIAELDNEVQARLVDAILSGRSIPHLMRSNYDSAYDGIYQAAMGWGQVEAPSAFREEILAVIADVKRQSAGATTTTEVPRPDEQ